MLGFGETRTDNQRSQEIINFARTKWVNCNLSETGRERERKKRELGSKSKVSTLDIEIKWTVRRLKVSNSKVFSSDLLEEKMSKHVLFSQSSDYLEEKMSRHILSSQSSDYLEEKMSRHILSSQSSDYLEEKMSRHILSSRSNHSPTENPVTSWQSAIVQVHQLI